jgi:hypothetical protein
MRQHLVWGALVALACLLVIAFTAALDYRRGSCLPKQIVCFAHGIEWKAL